MNSKIGWLKKPAHFGLVLLLAVILGIGVTVAFFTDIESAVNRFTTGKVEIKLEETIKGLEKTNIKVTNGEKALKCYIRVRVNIPSVTYQYNDDPETQALISDVRGNVMPASRWNSLLEGYTLPASEDINVEDVWEKMDDGFWYLSVVLEPNASVPFLGKITYPGLLVDGELKLPGHITEKMLAIPIVAEAIQVEGIKVDGTGATAAYEAFHQ